MNYWHIQLDKPQGRKSGGMKINPLELLGLSPPVIGTGEWIDNQCANFKNVMTIGDIILIRKGKHPIALVEVTSNNFRNNKLQQKYINENWREVKVLSIFKNDSSAEKLLSELLKSFNTNYIQSSGTITKCINNNATNQFVKKWHTLTLKHLKMKNITNLLEYKKQIILQGPPGTGKTRESKDIAEQIIYGKVSEDKKQQKATLEDSEQFKLVQFHPAYSYEDFVRGIVVKTDNNIPEYKTVNKIIGEFAKKANESNLSGGIDDFDRAWFELVQDINDGTVTKVGSSELLVDMNSQNNIKFKNVVATYEKTYELYKFGETDLKYETYHKIVLNYLKDAKGKYKLKDYVSPKAVNSNKPYILIIDEINRANLPAVLGELIYALEYRGEKVESMYATLEEGNTLILPPNLYIIGTMNTSDRSVDHIDYAIRRRFAFIDILPKVLQGDNFELDLFKQVSALFIQNFDEYIQNNTVVLKLSEHLSEEFRPEDVWLGHSYFIKNEGDFSLRKKYEIVPILKEYVKDGILKQSAEPIINAL